MQQGTEKSTQMTYSKNQFSKIKYDCVHNMVLTQEIFQSDLIKLFFPSGDNRRGKCLFLLQNMAAVRIDLKCENADLIPKI